MWFGLGPTTAPFGPHLRLLRAFLSGYAPVAFSPPGLVCKAAEVLNQSFPSPRRTAIPGYELHLPGV